MDGLRSPVDPALLALQRSTEPNTKAARSAEQARQVAEEFEALFLAQMLTPMFANIQTDGPFGGGFSETIYQSMLTEQYGKVMAKRGGVGVADAVMAEILKLQEVNGHEHDSPN
ncbi:MAG: rod-binding protein [Pseudomonadota bacterium]